MFAETEAAKETPDIFKRRLAQIENEIEERNKDLDIPYTVLQPSKITCGIAG